MAWIVGIQAGVAPANTSGAPHFVATAGTFAVGAKVTLFVEGAVGATTSWSLQGPTTSTAQLTASGSSASFTPDVQGTFTATFSDATRGVLYTFSFPAGPVVDPNPAVAFEIETFAATTPVVEVGQTVTAPAFTATLSLVPDTLVLSDDAGTAPKTVTSTPNSFASSGVFTKTAAGGATVTFSLAGTKGTVAATKTATIAWQPRIFWGVGAAGQSSAAFILALANSALAAERTRGGAACSVTAGTNQKVYYAHRSAYGAAAFRVGGFLGGFGTPVSVSVTNAYGVQDTYYLYESNQAGLGSISFTVE